MAEVVVKRTGRIKCRWPKPYECVTGVCTRNEYRCVSSGRRTCGIYRRYACPDGYCAYSDSACLRPCGVKNKYYRYSVQCPGVDETMCALSRNQCPKVCKRFRCPDGRCRSNELFCTPCTGYRCQSGICLPKSVKCNGVTDCENGADEMLCFNNIHTDSGTGSGGFDGGAVGPASGFAFLLVMVMALCCRIKYGRQYTSGSRNDTRALRRFMSTIHHLSEAGHLRHYASRDVGHESRDTHSPPSFRSTPSPRLDEPAPPYTELTGSSLAPPGLAPAPPYTEHLGCTVVAPSGVALRYCDVEAPPSYEEAVASNHVVTSPTTTDQEPNCPEYTDIVTDSTPVTPSENAAENASTNPEAMTDIAEVEAETSEGSLPQPDDPPLFRSTAV